VKSRLAPLSLETPVIAPVIPQPKANKGHRDNHAINDDGGGEFKHREARKSLRAAAG
jgi:hypothetical protein